MLFFHLKLKYLIFTAGASILFLVPLYVDPAVATLFSEFIERPTLCVTTRREDLTGLLNCSWSSCREGKKKLHLTLQRFTNLT